MKKTVGSGRWTAPLLVAALALAASAPANAGAGKGNGVGGGGGGGGNTPPSHGSQPLGPCDLDNAVINRVTPALACFGYEQGNDQPDNVLAQLEDEGWAALFGGPPAQYKDRPTAGVADLFDSSQDADDASRGSLTLLMDLNGPFALTLKGGNEWAAYRFGGAQAGDVITFDIPGEQGAGFSHASIYTAATPSAPIISARIAQPDVARVPEPGTLVLAALGAMGLLARRRAR